MSNSSHELNTATRTMIASALLGGTASVACQWQQYQSGEIDVAELTKKALIDASKAGAAGGVASAMGGVMAGRPALSVATLLLGGAAALYLIDDVKEKQHEPQ
ncbi:hypothetical protein [Ferrimonas senticii]|uniref:hypothetical protein n=1 Tax=Ferrimonas senticii TaxID=394566 RepID=UPI0003FE8435|nr:hypothetical protein [Ferrimonas senticii]